MNIESLFTLLKTAEDVDEIDIKREEIADLIPEIRIMFDYDQKNHAHQYDLWMHCLHTVINLPRNLDDDMLYLAALLHDIGKPDCQVKGTKEGDTNMHYYGHQIRSMEIVRDEVMKTLVDNGILLPFDDCRRLIYYVRYHDDRVSLKIKHLKEHMKIATLDEFKKLMLLQVADAKAHVQIPIIAERVLICTKLSGEYADELYKQIEQEDN